MDRFADVLDRLVTTTQRNGKIRLLANYFRSTPDPDRGFALAALTDGLPISFPMPPAIVPKRELAPMSLSFPPLTTE